MSSVYSIDLCVTPRFDTDLNAAKDDSNSEVQAKVRLAREKEQLQTDLGDLKERVKVGSEGRVREG